MLVKASSGEALGRPTLLSKPPIRQSRRAHGCVTGLLVLVARYTSPFTFPVHRLSFDSLRVAIGNSRSASWPSTTIGARAALGLGNDALQQPIIDSLIGDASGTSASLAESDDTPVARAAVAFES